MNINKVHPEFTIDDMGWIIISKQGRFIPCQVKIIGVRKIDDLWFNYLVSHPCIGNYWEADSKIYKTLDELVTDFLSLKYVYEG